MFKIYSLALLSFLLLQNSYAADEKEEFPGEASMRRRIAAQQGEIDYLQHSFKRLFQTHPEKFLQASASVLPSASKDENISGNKEDSSLLASASTIKLEDERKIKEFEQQLGKFKSNLLREGAFIIEDTRRENEKQKREIIEHSKEQERKFENQLLKQKDMFECTIKEANEKEAIKYRQLGITSFLKGLDEENLPSQERSPSVSLDDFPLTFDRPDKNNDRICLRLAEEDWQSLRESGVNQDLIDNLFSHLQTDVSALYDMIQRGYRIRQEQNRQ